MMVSRRSVLALVLVGLMAASLPGLVPVPDAAPPTGPFAPGPSAEGGGAGSRSSSRAMPGNGTEGNPYVIEGQTFTGDQKSPLLEYKFTHDHYVIRTFAPQQTIGGGIVLEANPSKERRFDEDVVKRLEALRTGEAGSVLEQYLLKHRFDARTLAAASKDLALADADAQEMLGLLVATGRARRLQFEAKEFLVHEKMLKEAREAVLACLTQFHKENPLRLGLKRPELRAKAATGFSVPLFEVVVNALVSEGSVVVEEDRVRLATHQIKLSPSVQKEFDRVEALFSEAGFSPPAMEEALAGVDKKVAQQAKIALLETGRLVDVGETVVLHRGAIAEAEKKIRALFAAKPELTASEIRQELGTTRKYIIPLLNYFDSRGITQRKGEVRILKHRANDE